MPWFALFLLLAGLFAWHQLSEPDLPWLLKAGELIWTEGIPRTDPFSFTRAGAEWIDAQWLFQALLHPVYRLGGFPALNLLAVALTALAAAMLYRVGRTAGADALTAAVGGLALWAASARLNLRPELLSFVWLAAMLLVIRRAEAGKVRELWLLPLIQWAWANSEGIWPVGLAVIFCGLGDAGWRTFYRGEPERQTAWRKWAGAAALATALCLATPYGWRGFVFPLRLLLQVVQGGDYFKQVIAEFQPAFSPGDPLWVRWPIPVLAALGLAAAIRARKDLRPFQWLLGAVLLALGLQARRNLGLFALYSFPLIARHLGAALENSPRRKLLGATCAGWFLLTAVTAGVTIGRGDFYRWDKSYRVFGLGFKETVFPAQAVAQLQEAGFQGRVFNQMAMGGYLIWRGYPAWRVYSDSRLELYGADFFRREERVFLDYREFVAEDEHYGFDAVVLNYRVEPLTPFILGLAGDPRWRLFYQDGVAVVFLKQR